MSKSADAFRTISEVSEWLETPAHVLRFWESRFPQIKPLKRAGGRRYYRPADMMLLGGIKKLLHEDGITIRGVQKILREKGVKHVCAFSPGLMDGVSETPETPLKSQADTPAPAPRSASVTPLRPRAKTGGAASDDARPQTHPDQSSEDEIPASPMAEDLPLLPPQREQAAPTPLAGFEGDTPEFLQSAPPASDPSTPDGPASSDEATSETADRSNSAAAEQAPSPDAAPFSGFAESPATDQPRGDNTRPVDEAPAPTSPAPTSPATTSPAQTESDSGDEAQATTASADTHIPDDPDDDEMPVDHRPVTALLRVPAAGRVPLPEQQRRQLGQLAQQLTGLRERVGNDSRF